MISIDANILIWGLDRASTVGLEHMIPLATEFFSHASTERIAVVIPSQALAEFLVRNTPEEREEALAKIDANFPIASLDFPASYIAAELTSSRNHVREVRETFGMTKQAVKADVNVIASAIAFGATHLITGNLREIRALAQGKIIVVGLEEYVEKNIRPTASAAHVSRKGKRQKGLFEPARSAQNGKVFFRRHLRRTEVHPLRREITVAPSFR